MGKKWKKNPIKEEVFELDEVLALGGTKDDFEMLKNIEEEASQDKKDTFKESEFKHFFESLGFDKVETEENEASVSKKRESRKEKKEKVSEPMSAVKPSIKKEKEGKSKEAKKQRIPVQDSQISSTTDVADKLQSTREKSPVPKIFSKILELTKLLPTKRTLCKPTSPWFANDVFKLPLGTGKFDASDPVIRKLKELGENLLRNEADLYKEKKSNKDSGDDSWMKTVVTSGTLSDKVAAYTLMLQNAPLHNSWCLDSFVHMLKKKGKREAIIGLDALRDIFLSEILPDSRKLRFFHLQPLDCLEVIFNKESGATSVRTEIQRHLIQWAYEDHVKSTYAQFVIYLRDFFLQDPLEAIKAKGMKAVLELLMSKPEQEKELLKMLVNKLGDPNHKIASKALHMLNCLIEEHPLMQSIVIHAVRDLLLRPNIQAKCQYYCICFLTGQILSEERKDVADLLIQVYLGFFKAAVKKKEVDNKLLSAILTGVNRAYPYASKENMKIMEELNVLYRTVHVSSFGTTVQAFMLLFQILSSRDELSDRYFNALYSSLLHPELPISTNRHPMFLNLLFRSLKADSSQSRVQAFLKRLLQTCTLQRASYTSAVIVLVGEIFRARPALLSFFDGGRFDSKTNDSKPATAGKKDLERVFGDDSDEEHFVDADEEPAESGEKMYDEKSVAIETSWTHRHKKSIHRNTTVYDPAHRNPMFANAENLPLWELHRICCHFHPSVSKFANELVDMAKQNGALPDRYPGDPLQDFTIMRFLDKYVYRNPKAQQQKNDNKKGVATPFRRKRKITFAEANAVPANTPEFLSKKNYNPEELFLQRYFTTRAEDKKRITVKEKTVSEQGSEIEEVSDDEFESYLASAEGQVELDKKYNFAEGAAGPSSKKRKTKFVEDSDEDEMEEDEDSDNFDEADEYKEDVEEDPFDEGGMDFADLEEDKPSGHATKSKMKPKKGKLTGKKRPAADVDAFDMMLEENAQNRFNTSGSGAVRNRDKSSAKQLMWERKQEVKDIVAKKRARKGASGFSAKGGRFGARNRQFQKQGHKKFNRRQK